MNSKDRNVTLGLWNCEGLRKSLAAMSDSELQRFDVFVFVETWETRPTHVPGFYAAHCPAKKPVGPGRPSGGVSVLYNNRLVDAHLLAAEDDTVVIGASNCLIIAMYITPSAPIETFRDKIDFACSYITPGKLTILCGDLNAPLNRLSSSRTKTLLEQLHSRGLFLLTDPDTPTFVGPRGSSTIDIIASSSPATYLGPQRNLSVYGSTPHLPVAASICVAVPSPRPRKQMTRRVIVPSLLFEQSQELRTHMDHMDLETTNKRIVEAILKSAQQLTRRKSKPWFDRECYEELRALRAATNKVVCGASRNLELAEIRAHYRSLISEKKRRFACAREVRLIEEAHANPYKWLRKKGERTNCPIPSSTLLEYFSRMFNSADTVPRDIPVISRARDELDEILHDRLQEPWSIAEVVDTINGLPKRKAAGPDRVYNEHLQQIGAIIPQIVTLLNSCLDQGKIPCAWKDCLLSIIPKGKGDPRDPTAWRGIAKRNVLSKLLSTLVSRRLFYYLVSMDVIPPEQHGFMPERSTLTACSTLLESVRRSTTRRNFPLYVLFVDYRSAFDVASRSVILTKLAVAGVDGKFLRLIASMLGEGRVSLDDGVDELPPFSQSTGVAQGDNLSPQLFAVLLNDLPRIIRREVDLTEILLFADDLALYSHSRVHLKRAIKVLESYSCDNGLQINTGKTKILKFGSGGPKASGDLFFIAGEQIEKVRHFTYLGLELCPRGLSLKRHLTARTQKARSGFTSIPTPHELSIETALALFDLKVAPAATYGIQLLWSEMRPSHFEVLDSLKARFLKRVLGVHRSTRNRLAYWLTGADLLSEETRVKFGLPMTTAFTVYRESWFLKMTDIEPEFFRTPAMCTTFWRGPSCKSRSRITRGAVHGYHHEICQNEGFHEADESCNCRLCLGPCGLYHVYSCVNAHLFDWGSSQIKDPASV